MSALAGILPQRSGASTKVPASTPSSGAPGGAPQVSFKAGSRHQAFISNKGRMRRSQTRARPRSKRQRLPIIAFPFTIRLIQSRQARFKRGFRFLFRLSASTAYSMKFIASPTIIIARRIRGLIRSGASQAGEDSPGGSCADGEREDTCFPPCFLGDNNRDEGATDP